MTSNRTPASRRRRPLRKPQDRPAFRRESPHLKNVKTVTLSVRIPVKDAERLLRFGVTIRTSTGYALSRHGEHGAWRGIVSTHDLWQSVVNNGRKTYWDLSQPHRRCCCCGAAYIDMFALSRHIQRVHGLDVMDAAKPSVIRRIMRETLDAGKGVAA